jgi:hypothetical protein
MPRVFWKWFAIGLGTALFLVWAQAQAVGGLAGMLQVGETSLVRPLIEAQLGSIPLADGPGHDGQIFYSMAIDLDGDVVGPLLDHPAYRYRRILFPLVASAFGLLDGWALLYGMVAVGIASMAASAGIVALMARRAGKSELLALIVVLNPGVWLSLQLLTSDALALALMLAGLYAFTTARSAPSVSSFALSGLAKDVSLATPIPLGARVRDWKTTLLPLTLLCAWMAALTFRFGDGFASRGNLDWPLAGIVEASSNWANFDSTEWIYLVFSVASVAMGIVFSFRRTWLQWPIIAWTGLAIVSSNWVWDFGNNSARAFAPLVVLVGLSSVFSLSDRRMSDRDRP